MAALTPMHCRPKPWKPIRSKASTSSAKSSMSPAGSAAIISNGPGALAGAPGSLFELTACLLKIEIRNAPRTNKDAVATLCRAGAQGQACTICYFCPWTPDQVRGAIFKINLNQSSRLSRIAAERPPLPMQVSSPHSLIAMLREHTPSLPI